MRRRRRATAVRARRPPAGAAAVVAVASVVVAALAAGGSAVPAAAAAGASTDSVMYNVSATIERLLDSYDMRLRPQFGGTLLLLPSIYVFLLFSLSVFPHFLRCCFRAVD